MDNDIAVTIQYGKRYGFHFGLQETILNAISNV
jgi:hypothetical protein